MIGIFKGMKLGGRGRDASFHAVGDKKDKSVGEIAIKYEESKAFTSSSTFS